jgi:hypothetical protein
MDSLLVYLKVMRAGDRVTVACNDFVVRGLPVLRPVVVSKRIGIPPDEPPDEPPIAPPVSR